MKRISLCFWLFYSFNCYSQFHPTNHTHLADTTIYLSHDSTCKMYVGFYLDYDEVEFLYDLKIDSSCKITEYKMQLYDRWGTLQTEITDKHLTYSVGYSRDDFHYIKQFIFFFNYKDENGISIDYHGNINDVWW